MVWHLATIFPKRFAPLCPSAALVQFFGFPTDYTPSGCHCGCSTTKDEVVPLQNQILVEELAKSGNVSLQCIPERASSGPKPTPTELYTWLLEQRLPNDRLDGKKRVCLKLEPFKLLSALVLAVLCWASRSPLYSALLWC